MTSTPTTTMEDEYESPKFVPPAAEKTLGNVDEADSSGDEDTPDWTKFPTATSGVARPIIPKRGEKDFEPVPGGGSSLQSFSLDRSRTAMVNALKATRGISSKSASYGIWIPALSRVHVLQARGVHFSNVGHSARRGPSTAPTQATEDARAKLPHSRLELLPEEALYLVERGSMFCYKQEGNDDEEMYADGPVEPGDSSIRGTPMSVQQAFADMIGKDDLTLERYQVYSYLKRLGYLCMRAEAPVSSPYYPVPAPRITSAPSTASVVKRLAKLAISSLGRFLDCFSSIFHFRKSCWAPLGLRTGVRDYANIFKSLRIIPAGHTAPMNITQVEKTDSPYKVFFNVWKPSTSWKKTAPPAPDFEIVVINARTTTLPTLPELSALFSTLPPAPLPVPRRRPHQQQHQSSPPQTMSSPTTLARILSLIGIKPLPPQPAPNAPRPPNVFVALKGGKKTVVLAVVESGTISFLRFGQGCFEEWPMI